jgi:hypothetical protein
MLNLEESIEQNSYYNNQKDFFSKIVLTIFPVIIFLTILSNQVPEMNLLQLIPGVYFFLLFFFLIIVINCTSFIFDLPSELDNKKENGSKTKIKLVKGSFIRLSFFLFFSFFILFINTLIPLSLDSLNSYGEKTIENSWSFDEVLSLEFFLLIILIFFSQFPFFITFYLTIEKKISFLPKIWKLLSFFAFLGAGSITPTMDAYTQCAFAFFVIFLYLVIINLVEKRLSLKFLSITSLH